MGCRCESEDAERFGRGHALLAWLASDLIPPRFGSGESTWLAATARHEMRVDGLIWHHSDVSAVGQVDRVGIGACSPWGSLIRVPYGHRQLLPRARRAESRWTAPPPEGHIARRC